MAATALAKRQGSSAGGRLHAGGDPQSGDTRRSGGRSIGEVVERLRSYVLGWKGYFQLAQTFRRWRTLDEWMRRRMRVLSLKHWRRGATMYRESLKLGAKLNVARSVAALSRRWWHNSMSALHHILSIAYFDALGIPRLT